MNAGSGSTRRARAGRISSQAGAALEPLLEDNKRFILSRRLVYADETLVELLDPGKTRRAYMRAYAWSWHDAVPGVVYDFCL